MKNKLGIFVIKKLQILNKKTLRKIKLNKIKKRNVKIKLNKNQKSKIINEKKFL